MTANAQVFSSRFAAGKKLGIFVCTTAASGAAFAASFSKNDRVEVVKEVPLYFKDKGEQLTVIAVQPENHLVFVAIRDAAGKEIALNLGDDAVALVRMSAAATISDTLQALCNPAKDSPGSTAANLPASMHARAPEAARMQASAQYGGKKQSEAAVLKGLKWLVAHQSADGSWGRSIRAR